MLRHASLVKCIFAGCWYLKSSPRHLCSNHCGKVGCHFYWPRLPPYKCPPPKPLCCGTLITRASLRGPPPDTTPRVKLPDLFVFTWFFCSDVWWLSSRAALPQLNVNNVILYSLSAHRVGLTASTLGVFIYHFLYVDERTLPHHLLSTSVVPAFRCRPAWVWLKQC